MDLSFMARLKQGYMYVRPSIDGSRWIGLQRLMFHFSLQSGPMGDLDYHERFCYPPEFDLQRMIEEWIFWDGAGDPRTGWVKDHKRDRCRVDGDPEQESIGWPAPSATSDR